MFFPQFLSLHHLKVTVSLIQASFSKLKFEDDLGKRRFRKVNGDVPITCWNFLESKILESHNGRTVLVNILEVKTRRRIQTAMVKKYWVLQRE